MTHSLVSSVVNSKTKIQVPFVGKDIKDAMNFGFSYFDSEDHIVEYIVASPKNLKRILGEINDSVLDPEGDSLGRLWTAKLLLSSKIGDSDLFFSNNTFSAVIHINLNPHSEE